MSNLHALTTPIQDLTFAVVDTETTGMYCQYNRVMDIGIVIVKNGEIVEEWEALIDPKQEVPYWITEFTGIDNFHVKGKPIFKHYFPKIKSYLDNSIFVAHNVGFDYGFIKEEFLRCEHTFIAPNLCTVKLARKLLPNLSGSNLDVLSDYYNIEISARHRALPDAQATAVVLLEFIKIAREKYNARTFVDLERLQALKIDKETIGDNLSTSRPSLFN
ncbi:MAG: exonuclease domain-containing protein [Patescibacteria group bacterium]